MLSSAPRTLRDGGLIAATRLRNEVAGTCGAGGAAVPDSDGGPDGVGGAAVQAGAG